MMEFLSKIMLIILIYVLVMNENELKYVAIKNDKYSFEIEDIFFTVLGFAFSHICLLVGKTLIKKF